MKKVFWLLFPCVAVAALGWFLKSESEFFLVRETPIDIEFDQNQTPLVLSLKKEIQTPLKALKGQNIWSIPLRDLQEQLEANPWIERVELQRRFPDRIATSIEIAEVSFIYVDKKNRMYPVFQSGKRGPRVDINTVPLAPFVYQSELYEDEAKRNHLLKVLRDIPQMGLFQSENLASVGFDSVRGFYIEFVDRRSKVYLGEKDIQTKALQVLRVSDYLKSQKQKARVIDASFTKKVLVRLRKGS
ncbi:MAG: FtsQ-type POTRA domain-containing protein [Pseudomonadota bacterium]